MIAAERAGRLAVRDDVVEAAARLHDIGRQSIYFQIVLVADHQPSRREKHFSKLVLWRDSLVIPLGRARDNRTRKAILQNFITDGPAPPRSNMQ
jgi:hypothetical protein